MELLYRSHVALYSSPAMKTAAGNDGKGRDRRSLFAFPSQAPALLSLTSSPKRVETDCGESWSSVASATQRSPVLSEFTWNSIFAIKYASQYQLSKYAIVQPNTASSLSDWNSLKRTLFFFRLWLFLDERDCCVNETVAWTWLLRERDFCVNVTVA